MKFKSIQERNYKLDNLLVSTDWLSDNIGDKNLVLLDLDTKEEYIKSHIPGSINVIDNYYKTSLEDRTHVQDIDQIKKTFNDLGITSESIVVGYDRSACLYSFRLAWVLHYYGHENVKVLDGGFPKWVYEKKSVEAGENTSTSKGDFQPKDPDPTIFSDKKTLIKILEDNEDIQILDVRSDDERNGINLRGGKRGGYIPKSVHKEWVEFNSKGEVPILKSSDEILSITNSIGLDPEKPIITYCQGGIRAAHVFWTLKLAGFSNVKNYDGSWREWGHDETCPIIDMTK
ncbi:MAG: sulfurtransferase [SAR202 cluster bacterium]|jgi:thiosulfate/3-mercaptopyruvate sulfurtransferase|nr:sulfurtransferase [SAR202 cluster bacterium]